MCLHCRTFAEVVARESMFPLQWLEMNEVRCCRTGILQLAVKCGPERRVVDVA